MVTLFIIQFEYQRIFSKFYLKSQIFKVEIKWKKHFTNFPNAFAVLFYLKALIFKSIKGSCVVLITSKSSKSFDLEGLSIKYLWNGIWKYQLKTGLYSYHGCGDNLSPGYFLLDWLSWNLFYYILRLYEYILFPLPSAENDIQVSRIPNILLGYFWCYTDEKWYHKTISYCCSIEYNWRIGE